MRQDVLTADLLLSQATLAGPAIRTVLVVDDSRLQRRILSSNLRKSGMTVHEAGSGAEAVEMCLRHRIDLVLSDWMMPGMTGLELCQALREFDLDRYVYFILLTSQSEKEAAAKGLSIGADDFLTKPVNAEELRARIGAAERILKMERELVEKNRLISTALGELRQVYDALDRDLKEARRLQQSLLPARRTAVSTGEVSCMLQPSGHVGGDMVGLLEAGQRELCIYGLDVSGHGIASALMTARLASHLSGTAPAQNIALTSSPLGVRVRDPAAVGAQLNAAMLQEMETDHYATLLLARIDLATGRLSFLQAGHPHPAIQRASGEVEFVGEGGVPLGLLSDAEFETCEARLQPGDRLLIYSDGVTECPTTAGGQLDEDGLAEVLRRHRNTRGLALLDALMEELAAASGSSDFDDDVSAILFEFTG